MKYALLVLLSVLFLSAESRAGHPVFIGIRTEPGGTRYVVNTQQKTVEEVEQFLRQVVAEFTDNGIYQDGIYVRPDDRTSFTTVFELLRRIRAAGVKRCEVIGSESSTHLVVTERDFPRERTPDTGDYFRPTPPAK